MSQSGISRVRSLATCWPVIPVIACSLIPLATAVVTAAPAREQQMYWWQDEIRTASFALSQTRSGRVSQWPRMSVPAGMRTSATRPITSAPPVAPSTGFSDSSYFGRVFRKEVGVSPHAYQLGRRPANAEP